MATTAVYPSGTNTFQPSIEASNKLIVDFSRNIKDFALNQWAQVIPVKKNVGLYVLMTVEQAGRILNTDGADFAWPDGQNAPDNNDGTEKFEFPSYTTKRKQFGFNLGNLSVDQAAWDILAQHGRISAQQAMTMRTQRAVTVATTSGSYAAANTSAVASITGNTGKWDVSTTARNDIQRSLHHAADVIRLGTLGAVKDTDLHLVMSPGCARKIRVSQEITDYIKGSAQATAQVRGELPGKNVTYGLPDRLFGYDVVIEDAVKVTSRKGATKVTSYVLADDTPFMASRVGALVSETEGPTFSTLSLFMLEEMTVESEQDKWNRLHKARVVEDYDAVLTAPVSGFLFTSAVT